MPVPTSSILDAPPPVNYERYFVPAIGEPLAQPLVRLAGLEPGERVIDIGCGTGVVARLAAGRVGAGGRVVGVDLEPGMLAVARSATPAHTAIEWRQGGAESLPVEDGEFDVALCQMSFQFFEDKVRALGEMRRVLAPGGRAVLGLPGPAALLFESLAESLGRNIHPGGRVFVERVFSLHSPKMVKRLLTEAGFSEVEARTSSHRLTLPGPHEFLWEYIGSTPLAGLAREADEPARRALEAEVVEAWQPFTRGKGMELEQAMLYAKAGRR